ncbi:hypothetical protein ACDK41_07570 [Haemophilus influenzae]
MKSQSNSQPLRHLPLGTDFYIPLKQHLGTTGNLLIKEGDYVLKGQALTKGDGLRMLPVHAPTSAQLNRLNLMLPRILQVLMNPQFIYSRMV